MRSSCISLWRKTNLPKRNTSIEDGKPMEDRTEMISTAQHEKEMTRMETANRRWFVAFMVVLVMLFATNAAWVIYESQFQDVVITQDGYSEGNRSNVFNGTGEVTYGNAW